MEIRCRAGVAARTILAAFIAGAALGAVVATISLDATRQHHVASLESSGDAIHEPLRLNGAASSVGSERPTGPSGTGRRVGR